MSEQPGNNPNDGSDLGRAGQERLEGSIAPPQLGNNFIVDPTVLDSLPIPGTELITAFNYGMSLWGRTAKLVCRLPTGGHINYFLKVTAFDEVGKVMTEGEFESLKEMHVTSPVFVPKPFAWGRYGRSQPETYFLLAEFRNVGEQPPDPVKFTARLAELHRTSRSPTGKFGFHTTTCHAFLTQITDCWDESWSRLFQRQLAHMVFMDQERNGKWQDFQAVCDLTLENVVPRLLEPLQSEGRSIKPCLIHGDLWDENTATDMDTGEPFVFDAGSMYAHNEYEIGNWRAPRHRLSDQSYIRNYKRNFPISEPEEEWDARNLLYSLRYDLATFIHYPRSNLRQSVFDGMTELCRTYFPDELRQAQQDLRIPMLRQPSVNKDGSRDVG
ncbi:MAG: hypothetical protein Q9224_001870 [Gallowayella concinna]